MYISTNAVQSSPENFHLRDGFHLDANNRWIILSDLIPWCDFEAEYASLFDDNLGAPYLLFE